MAREIKFRFWSGKQMFEHDDFDGIAWHSFHKDFTNPVPFSFGYEGNFFEENYISMQYTGYKGENDIDVYDGDVLPDFYDEDGVSVVVWDDKNLQWAVDIYNYSTYTNEGGSEENGPWQVIGREPLSEFLWPKVVGNIYENPELIKESQ